MLFPILRRCLNLCSFPVSAGAFFLAIFVQGVYVIMHYGVEWYPFLMPFNIEQSLWMAAIEHSGLWVLTWFLVGLFYLFQRSPAHQMPGSTLVILLPILVGIASAEYLWGDVLGPHSAAADPLIESVWPGLRLQQARRHLSVTGSMSGFLAVIAVGIRLHSERRTRKEGARCVKCSYLLKGLPEPRCPECGTPFDDAVAGKRARKRQENVSGKIMNGRPRSVQSRSDSISNSSCCSESTARKRRQTRAAHRPHSRQTPHPVYPPPPWI